MQIVEASYPPPISRKKVGGTILEQNDSCVISSFGCEVDKKCNNLEESSSQNTSCPLHYHIMLIQE
jgi:hypothetical protein